MLRFCKSKRFSPFWLLSWYWFAGCRRSIVFISASALNWASYCCYRCWYSDGQICAFQWQSAPRPWILDPWSLIVSPAKTELEADISAKARSAVQRSAFRGPTSVREWRFGRGNVRPGGVSKQVFVVFEQYMPQNPFFKDSWQNSVSWLDIFWHNFRIRSGGKRFLEGTFEVAL